jgi:YD repeat-containing protein
MKLIPGTIFLLVLVAGAAPPSPPAPPAPRLAQSPRGLASEPLVAEAIGLRMYLPAGGAARSATGPDGVSYLASDEAQNWSLRISTLLPAVAGASAAGLAADQLQAVQKTGRPVQVMVNGPRPCGTIQGHLLYVQQSINNQAVVNGWLMLPTSPQSFVVVTIFADAREFPRLRPIFDACFDTIQLRSAAELADQREARLARGREVLATFTPQRLRAAAFDRQWYRVYRPGPSGRSADDTELAFMSLQVGEGKRGELTPERAPEAFGAMESELGLLLLLEARYLLDDPKAGGHVDVDARYWMNWDRQSEAWSVRYTRRVGTVSRTAADTGVRSGPRLEVIHSSREEQTREPETFQVPEVYLCQAEVLLLGALLPRDGPASGEMAFACYDPKARRLIDRVDSWKLDRQAPHWVLTTIQFSDTAPIRQVYDASGRRLQRTDPDGTITERMDPGELRKLWQSKGLPSGPAGRSGE